VKTAAPFPPLKYFSWSVTRSCATPRWVDFYLGGPDASSDLVDLREFMAPLWQKRLERLWARRRPQVSSDLASRVA
jgi:hypothetical protein